MASSWGDYGPMPSSGIPQEQPQSGPPDNSSRDRQKKQQQPRQLLSCTKCRERKVKCDRTKPCSACCARGHPKECHFVVGEGSDYGPIQQSYELRKLRIENQRLKERLQAARLPLSRDENDDASSPDRAESKAAARATAVRQRRFKTGDRVDNLYFGTPGLANIISDFASLQLGSASLTHTMPRGADMYAAPGSMYPFPTMWPTSGDPNCIPKLLSCLPPPEQLYECLDLFQKRAQSCSFPHVPDEITRKEVERFLADARNNAERFPDMLALIFAALATGVQMGSYDKNGSQWAADQMRKAKDEADVYSRSSAFSLVMKMLINAVAASMQALRTSSFMSQPTLLGIQTLIMMGPYLTNSGRFLDAWTLFGTIIRLAHSIGLHRNPKYLDPSPPLRESTIRQTLWWWMLHMDQQYSVTLGRPLGISGIGDCPPPEPLTTDPTILRLSEFVDQFTILARQILSSDRLMNVQKIDEFTDKLVTLWDTMPEALRFNESWAQPDTDLPDWPLDAMSAVFYCKVLSFLVLINRQRVERTQSAAETSPGGAMPPPPRPQSNVSSSGPYGTPQQDLHPPPLRGRELVLHSSFQILQAFMFLYFRIPAALICWTMGQQAFNACMILILDALETGDDQHGWLIDQVFQVFRELDVKEVHSLAKLAVTRISAGLLQLGQRRQEREAMYQSAGPSSRRSSDTTLMFGSNIRPDMSFANDSVMGNTGMFLLEDPGLQSFTPQAFAPLGWNMAGDFSNPPTPIVPTPSVPISSVTAAPFPVMTTPFIHGTSVQPSPYALGLQPRMPTRRPSMRNPNVNPASFTPINTNIVPAGSTGRPIQQSFSPNRGPRQSNTGAGPRGIHRPAKASPRRR